MTSQAEAAGPSSGPAETNTASVEQSDDQTGRSGDQTEATPPAREGEAGLSPHPGAVEAEGAGEEAREVSTEPTGRGSEGVGAARPRLVERLRERRRVWRARWGRSAAHFLGDGSLMAGSLILLGYLLIGLLSPLFYRGNPDQLGVDENVLNFCASPSGPTLSLLPFHLGAYPLGQTAHLGLNIAQALALGTRWDLLMLAVVVGVSALLGSFLGALAGARGGWVESLLAPIFDNVLAFPPILIVVVVLAVTLAPTQLTLRSEVFVGALVAVLWAPFGQGVRAQARILVRRPFVEASRAAGARWPRILSRHILPNCAAAVLAQVPATVFNVLFVLGAYLYLGLEASPLKYPVCGCSFFYCTLPGGVYPLLPSPRFPEWTWTLANGIVGVTPSGGAFGEWWGLFVPMAWIAIFVLGVTLVCDGLVGWLSPAGKH